MTINWEYNYRPSTIEEMALYPALRERLEFYVNYGSFPHLILHGDTGTGKTTAARILTSKDDLDVMEIDCALDSTKTAMMQLAKGSTFLNVLGSARVYIMDEFHDVDATVQKVFNKVMEDRADKFGWIFCVNDIDGVAPPIISRCTPLRFDVVKINNKSGKLHMLPYTKMKRIEWVAELCRVARMVAEKDGRTITAEQLGKVASNNLNLVDVRSFIRGVEERIKMDEVKDGFIFS